MMKIIGEDLRQDLEEQRRLHLSNYELRSIDVGDIIVGERLRSTSSEGTSVLATSMQEMGLRTPISVRMAQIEAAGGPLREIPVLVAGATRLAAAKKLGWKRIDCFVLRPDDLDTQLWEIDENLARTELTPAEIAEHMVRRKELWEQKLLAENGTGCPIFQDAGRGHKGFAQDTAEKTGRHKRNINKAVARGKKIAPDVLRKVKGSEFDTGVVLDKLAKLSPEDQRKAINGAADSLVALETNGEARSTKREANDKLAELLAMHIPRERWNVLTDSLYTAGYKRLAGAFARLAEIPVSDETHTTALTTRSTAAISVRRVSESRRPKPCVASSTPPRLVASCAEIALSPCGRGRGRAP
jgi:hypothetical protein